MGPLVFKPILVPKIWGGRAMARVAGKSLPEGNIGESWEICDHTNGMSVVAEGPLAGKTLRELIEKHGRSIFGRSGRIKRFPLLMKVLDARQRLSVQVHPDDALARKMRFPDTGKTEAWYILASRRNGALASGLKNAADLPRLREMAESGELAAQLRIDHPKPGEIWVCRAGAIHALGPGLVLLEVQQNSDTSLRLFDWGRKGLDGRPRPLHVEESIRAVGDGGFAVRKSRPKRYKLNGIAAEQLALTDKFVMDRWRINKRATRVGVGRFEMLYVVSGTGKLIANDGPPVWLMRGRSVLVPAAVKEYQIVPEKPIEIVRSAEPEAAHAS